VNPASNGADWIFILVAWIGRTDHGEEIEDEEEIDEIQKESGAGAQKEEGSEICGAQTGETLGEKGGSEAQGAGQKSTSGPEAGSGSADARARTGAVMDAAGQPGVWRKRQHLRRVPLRLRLTERHGACASARRAFLRLGHAGLLPHAT
jgi:hypothetical protein